MPNKLGEDWSRNRALDSGVRTSVTRPFSITDSQLLYTITSGDNKGEKVECLPTTKLQYKCDFLLVDDGSWGDILSWIVPDVDIYYIRFKLHTYIGSDYNRTTKKWNTLYEHHVWDFKVLAAQFTIGSIPYLTLMGLSGKPTCKVYKTYTSSSKDVYTEPFKSKDLTIIVDVGGDVQLGSASAYVTVGDSSSAYSDWFYIEGDFPVNTGMYAKLLIENADDYTVPSNQFATLLTVDSPKIFSYYDEITGNSHILYKQNSSYNYDELRLPINTTIESLSNATYDNAVYRRTQYSTKYKFMSLLVTEKLEKYIVWQEDNKIKVKHSNANIAYEEVIVVEGSSNPVGYYDTSANTGYIFYCKDNKIYVVSTFDFVTFSEPVIFVDNTDGNIGKQSVGVVEDNAGSLYVLYYDSKKLPQSKLFAIEEIQATSSEAV